MWFMLCPLLATRYWLFKEEPALGFPLGGIVGLPVNIRLDVGGGRVGARLGELGGGVGLGARFLVDLRGGRFGEHALGEERFLEKLDRILRVPILLDLGLGAVGV